MKTTGFGRVFPLPGCMAALASVLIACNAWGQSVIYETFASYSDDASLTTVWPRVSGTSDSIFLAPDPLDAANQAIEQTTAAGRIRQVMSGIIPTAERVLSFSFDFYDTTGGSANGRVYAEIRNSAAATGLLAAGVYNSVNTGTYDVTRYQARNVDSGGWIQLSTQRTVGWHNFRFEIAGNTVSLYVDNVLEPSFSNLPYAGNVSYDWVHLGSALTGNTPAYFDNVQISIVPEPKAWVLGLLGLGAFWARGLFRRRR